MSFGDHLEELRSRMIRALLGLVVGTGICIYFGEYLLGFLTQPYSTAMIDSGYTPELVNLDPTETFVQYFKICIIFGLGLSSPYGVYQIWQFVAAGLYPHERRWVSAFAPAALVLFTSGVIFLIKVVLPVILMFLIQTVKWVPNPVVDIGRQHVTATPSTSPMNLPILKVAPEKPSDGDAWILDGDGSLNWVIGGRVMRVNGNESTANQLVRPQYTLQLYLSFVSGLCLAFGVGFQMPIVVALLVLSGVVSTDTLSRSRRFIILGIAIASAILTPPDMVSQLLLGVPMWLLFEVGMVAGRMVEKGRKKAADASGDNQRT